MSKVISERPLNQEEFTKAFGSPQECEWTMTIRRGEKARCTKDAVVLLTTDDDAKHLCAQHLAVYKIRYC